VYGVGPDAQANTALTQFKKCSFGAQDIQATHGNGVQNGVVDVNADINIARATSRIATQIIAATESQLAFARKPRFVESTHDFVMFCMPNGSMFGTAAKPPAALLYTGDRTAFSRKATAA
jgi:hypothetical protein